MTKGRLNHHTARKSPSTHHFTDQSAPKTNHTTSTTSKSTITQTTDELTTQSKLIVENQSLTQNNY